MAKGRSEAIGLLDAIYTNDRGTYNVTRALRDCEAGEHRLWRFGNLAGCVTANASVEVDGAKIERFTKAPEILEKPLLFVNEDGRLYLIDGHHRLRAMGKLGRSEFMAYLIEAEQVARYRIEIRVLAPGVMVFGHGKRS
jgi:hypothetical protein